MAEVPSTFLLDLVVANKGPPEDLRFLLYMALHRAITIDLQHIMIWQHPAPSARHYGRTAAIHTLIQADQRAEINGKTIDKISTRSNFVLGDLSSKLQFAL